MYSITSATDYIQIGEEVVLKSQIVTMAPITSSRVDVTLTTGKIIKLKVSEISSPSCADSAALMTALKALI